MPTMTTVERGAERKRLFFSAVFSFLPPRPSPPLPPAGTLGGGQRAKIGWELARLELLSAAELLDPPEAVATLRKELLAAAGGRGVEARKSSAGKKKQKKGRQDKVSFDGALRGRVRLCRFFVLLGHAERGAPATAACSCRRGELPLGNGAAQAGAAAGAAAAATSGKVRGAPSPLTSQLWSTPSCRASEARRGCEEAALCLGATRCGEENEKEE